MKKLIILIIAIAPVLITGSVLSCKSSGKTSSSKLLKFNLEKGKGYDYDIIWDMDQKIMEQESKISIGVLYSIKVDDDKDHIKSLTGTYRSFRMNMEMMGIKINVDTDKPGSVAAEDEPGAMPQAMMNRVFSGIVGKSFNMKVDEEGKVLEVSGFREMLQGIADSMELDEDKKEKMIASMNDQFNEQTVKDQFGQVFTIFPNKEIKVGDSWDKSYSAGGKLPATFTTTYTVKEIEGDHVTLGTKTRIQSNGETPEINGDQTGDMLIDSKMGLLINAEFSQKMETKVEGTLLLISGKGKIKGKAN